MASLKNIPFLSPQATATVASRFASTGCTHARKNARAATFDHSRLRVLGSAAALALQISAATSIPLVDQEAGALLVQAPHQGSSLIERVWLASADPPQIPDPDLPTPTPTTPATPPSISPEISPTISPTEIPGPPEAPGIVTPPLEVPPPPEITPPGDIPSIPVEIPPDTIPGESPLPQVPQEIPTLSPQPEEITPLSSPPEIRLSGLVACASGEDSMASGSSRAPPIIPPNTPPITPPGNPPPFPPPSTEPLPPAGVPMPTPPPQTAPIPPGSKEPVPDPVPVPPEPESTPSIPTAFTGSLNV